MTRESDLLSVSMMCKLARDGGGCSAEESRAWGAYVRGILEATTVRKRSSENLCCACFARKNGLLDHKAIWPLTYETYKRASTFVARSSLNSHG